MVVPDPEKGSYTAWPGEELFSIGRFMHSTGFSVPWPEAFRRCGIGQMVVWFRPPAQ